MNLKYNFRSSRVVPGYYSTPSKLDKITVLTNRLFSINDRCLIRFSFSISLPKIATCRKFFSKDFFVKYLLELLDSNDFGQVKQTCRAIGNICYENGK